MIAVWAIFALMVYVLEPLVLHERFREFVFHNDGLDKATCLDSAGLE